MTDDKPLKSDRKTDKSMKSERKTKNTEILLYNNKHNSKYSNKYLQMNKMKQESPKPV